MRRAVDVAHEIGLPIFGWARISNELTGPTKFGPTTPFHLAHPEAFQRDRDDRERPRLSFAYPEVRAHKIALLCKIAAYGTDGILVDVLRHPPMASLNLPLVEGFLGPNRPRPPPLPNDGDADWLRYRAGAFTQFLRDARQALDAQTVRAPVPRPAAHPPPRPPRRRFPLWVRTVDQPWRNLVVGCDVDRWLAEGLIDGIIFGPHGATAGDYPEQLDLTAYITPGPPRPLSRLHLRPGLALRLALPGPIPRPALYRQGVDGVALYESEATTALATLRPHLWRLGRPAAM